MKVFETPVVEVTMFEVADIITTSEDFIAPTTGENQTPYG